MKNKAINFLNTLINDNTTKKEIDIIDFIKKCVKEYKENKEEVEKVKWENFFQTLWEIYPRKANKQLAMRTFEHKIRGLDELSCREKCNNIYKAILLDCKKWKYHGTEMQFIPHFSSWLNAVVPNSPKYKGR